MKGRKATAGGGSAKLGFGPECFTCLTLVVAVVSPCLVFLCDLWVGPRGPPMRSVVYQLDLPKRKWFHGNRFSAHSGH